MSSEALALFGGKPTISTALTPFKSIGKDELDAATEVIRTGVLSGYIGAPGDGFLGGPHVRAFEEKSARYFGIKHAIAVNSWTSGLIAAVAAIGIEPGDEIITTPWTMAATATAILHFNGIPVFADIDPVSFNIDPASVEKLISPRTRAIMAVDIFGQSADMVALREIADRHGIKLLSDTAQAPGATFNNRFAGTLADIGGYSLNYHKHIHSGEGGIIVTDDDRLADRMRLIRNHAEAVIRSSDPDELNNMLGYNFRLGEIEAAIADVQLDKLASRVESRRRAADRFNAGLASLEALATPVVSKGCTHVYYVYGIVLDVDTLGVSRQRIVEALKAEGVPWLMNGYQNIHMFPIFQHKIAYGSKGFPWNQPFVSREVDYGHGICPVAEDLHERRFLGLNFCMGELEDAEVDSIVTAFRKVWDNLDALRTG
ncbi:MAG: DegT/DnrJ/EryC1/StrS family aminotransferase [Devosia marina]|uniref:DegT/DnrJ/EryC1/StrS family aminotransferase n=1 Tax=Devosia marina TaxID=2683198 RepID=UPI0032EFFFB1